MNSSNNKLEKSERKYLLHRRTKVNERRKYSMCQLNLVARVETRKRSKDMEMIETKFGMQMIAN